MKRDIREYSSQTTSRLITGSLLVLLLGGAILIYFMYGLRAALMGLFCIIGGLLPVGLIWLFLQFSGWIVKKNQDH
jgi:hypothetical protein